jgi:uncharacterized DUF497 family protein
MEFEWNPEKAVINLRKHNVSFKEATTVFDDSLSVTFPDPDHLIEENRYVIMACQDQGDCWLSLTLTAKTALESSVPEKLLARKEGFMKKEIDELEDELCPEYNFSKMAGGVRGKYVERYRVGTNLVLLEPDVAQAFPTDASMNEALRLLIQIAQRQQPNNPVEAD